MKLNKYKLIITLHLCFSFHFANAQQEFKKDSLFSNINYILLDTISNKTIQNYANIDQTFIYQYKKTNIIDVFRFIPDDLYQLGKFTIQKENLKWDALALGSTAVLIPFDQKILDSSDKLGSKLGGWEKDSQYKKAFGILSIIPQNIPSAVYYIGNGGTTLLLSGVFYSIGKFNKNDLRALNTSNELIESIISVGITTQTIKRITGRQSPVRALFDDNDGGNWQLFPSFKSYQSNTPNYDAMPSGHLATFMAAVTIISTNYPEIKWIKPVGYSLTSLLAFNMLTGKVHWASDYPIAILIGYVMGKNIANRRINKIKKNEVSSIKTNNDDYKISYQINKFNNSTLYGITLKF